MAGDVDVLGQFNYLDVWNHDRFSQQAAARALHRRAMRGRSRSSAFDRARAGADGRSARAPAARARRPVRRLHRRPWRPCSRSVSRRRKPNHRARSRSGGARARRARRWRRGATASSSFMPTTATSIDVLDSHGIPLIDGALADLGRVVDAARRSPGAGSASSATSRSTCAWIRRGRPPPRTWSRTSSEARARRRDLPIRRRTILPAHCAALVSARARAADRDDRSAGGDRATGATPPRLLPDRSRDPHLSGAAHLGEPASSKGSTSSW